MYNTNVISYYFNVFYFWVVSKDQRFHPTVVATSITPVLAVFMTEPMYLAIILTK